ncbi:MAG TPA: hypothetical protein VFE05_06215 [Longimicrobiaceae bacterium]|nr:hypothetical protein [Longimicrobiaceae bacterium]
MRKPPLDTGDRVAWTERDRGVVVAHNPPERDGGARLTVAVWRDFESLGHLARVPSALLHTVPRLRPAAVPGRGRADHPFPPDRA